MGGAAVLLAVPVLCCRLSHFAREDVAHDRVLSWREGQILVVLKIVCVLRTLIYPPYDDGDAGAVVLPASPGFYHGATSIRDLVDFVVARICDQLEIRASLMRRWGED